MGNVIKRIPVNTGRSYEVVIGEKLLDESGEMIAELGSFRRVAVITDNLVSLLYAQRLLASLNKSGFQTCMFSFENGEGRKNHATLCKIYDFLAENQITRSDIIIALGGGVVGDITGFAAATYLRGVSYMQIPTTLLAQVDSSVGGKTAVNIAGGKNLVGAFWQPRLVICDTETLKTLPEQIFAEGMAEVIKYAAIKSAALFEFLNQPVTSQNHDGRLGEVIAQCIDIKRAVVEQDEHDCGLRMILNFGHTLGHGIERLSGYGKISHGQAVAMGMVMMTKASEAQGDTETGCADRLQALIKKYRLQTQCPFTPQELLQSCYGDKKRQGDNIHIIVLSRIGQCVIKKISVSDFADYIGARG